MQTFGCLFAVFAVVLFVVEESWPGVSELPGYHNFALLGHQPQRPDGLYGLTSNSFTTEGARGLRVRQPRDVGVQGFSRKKLQAEGSGVREAGQWRLGPPGANMLNGAAIVGQI